MTAHQHGRFNARWLPDPAAVGDYRTFLATAVRHPAMVGAATPTTNAVASTVAQVVPTTGTPVVVELGPGTGSLSGAIQGRLPTGSRHIGIELGADLVQYLRARQPRMETVHGNASDLGALLDDLGVDRVDAVISSIPWSLLDDTEQLGVLRQACEALAPEGVFTALTYLPMQLSSGGHRFRRQLDTTFDEVLTHTTWRSLPPILHYICRRPL